MKKVLCLLMVLVMALGCAGISASAAEYGIVLNNNVALVVGSTTAIAKNALQTLPVAPTLVDGSVLIPLRAVSEFFNGSVSYDDATGIIDIRFGQEKHVVMRSGSVNYTLNGRGYTFSVAPQNVNGSVLVPLRALAQDILEQTVFYDEATQLIVISSRAVLQDSVTDAAVISAIATAIATRNLPEITVPTSYQLDWEITEPTIGGDTTPTVSADGKLTAPTGSKVTLNGNMVTASANPEAANPATSMVDGNSSTYWAVENANNAVIDLGSVISLSCVGVQMRYYEDGRMVNYGIEVSTDGSSYTSLYSGQSPAGGQVMEYIAANTQARYVRINVNGSTTNGWASVSEIEVYSVGGSGTAGTTGGGTAGGPAGTKVALSGSMVTATANPEAANPATNMVDGDSSTYWAVENANNATIDLGSVMSLTSVGVQMRYYDDGRMVNYGVEVSTDGSTYTSLFNGQSPAGGSVMEYITANTEARYVRINVNGSTTNGWASVTEVEVYTASGASGGGTTGGSFQNMTSVTGEFVIAVYGTTNVLTVGSDGFTLSVAPSTGDGSQLWTYENGESFRSKSLGYMMDVAGESRDEGGQICVWQGTGGINQTWSLELDGDGYYIKSGLSGLYLSVSGGNVQQLSRANATKWVIADPNAVVPGGSVISGEFTISVYGTDNVLTVGSDNFTLSVGTGSDSDAQLWTRENSSFRNVGSGLYMDVSGQSYDEGGQICVWEGNGGTNQSWVLEQDGDGYYVKSAMSGLYLSVDSSGNVQQLSRANATKWAIAGEEVEIVTEPVDPNTPVTMTEPVEGEFRLTVYGTNRVVTLDSGTSQISVVRNEGDPDQIWTMGTNEYGFTLINNATGTVLETPGQSLQDGIKISVWEDNGGQNQAWIFEKVGNYYYIKNAMSGLYLVSDVAGLRQRSFEYATMWSIRPNN